MKTGRGGKLSMAAQRRRRQALDHEPDLPRGEADAFDRMKRAGGILDVQPGGLPGLLRACRGLVKKGLATEAEVGTNTLRFMLTPKSAASAESKAPRVVRQTFDRETINATLLLAGDDLREAREACLMADVEGLRAALDELRSKIDRISDRIGGTTKE